MTQLKALLNRLTARLPEPLVLAWARFDPKLKYTLLTGVLGWVVAKYGIELDADVAFYISGAIASLVGYNVPNDGTVLRTDQEDGNAELPLDRDPEDAGYEVAEEGEPELPVVDEDEVRP